MQEYIGYHGTSKESAEIIIHTNHFLPSRGLDEWLGVGVYFFQYYDDAKWWCEFGKHLTQGQYQVVKARLMPNTVIDLLGSREDIERFYTFCEAVKSKSKYLPSGKIRDNYMSLAIKMLLKQAVGKVDMIIGGFRQNRRKWYGNKGKEARQFPLVPLQIQYCVLNHDCIVDMQIYEMDRREI